MWNGTILSLCPECSGWTIDQLACGVLDPNPPKTLGYQQGVGKAVSGYHVEEDPEHIEYRLHAGGWVPSGIPVPICVPDKHKSSE